MSNVIQFEQNKKEKICAFCKKPRSSVKRLIGEEGRQHICDVCLKKCNELISNHDDSK